MGEEDLGAVDEGPESSHDPEDAEDKPERSSRPVPKSEPASTIELSRTFQSEVEAKEAKPLIPDTPSTVKLSETFQSEVDRLGKPKPKPKPKIPPPKLPLKPIPPPGRGAPGKEVARAERLARRLRDRRSSQKIPAAGKAQAPPKPEPAPRPKAEALPKPEAGPSPKAQARPKPQAPPRPPPPKRPIPSRDATLDGMPFEAVPLDVAPGATPEEATPEEKPAPLGPPETRATIEGPIPAMEEVESAAPVEEAAPPTIRPPPSSPPPEGTEPALESPPQTPLEPTPTGTARATERSFPATVLGPAQVPDAEAPPFESELIDSDSDRRAVGDASGTDPSLEVDLSATFRSEVIGFDEGEGASEPPGKVERTTDTEGERDSMDDPFGDLSTGTELGGRYRLERIIGRGATGVVFEASHMVIGKRVALKCLYPHYLETPNAVERFFREARIAATVEHPNVVQVFDGGDAGDTMFLAMELLHGETLGDRLERGPLPIDEALEMFLKVSDAVAAVHERGVVHRDLKPDNVFLPIPKGDRPLEPKVLDFGVSKLKEPGRKELTSLGTVLGTPYYMSPEQIRNTRDVDATADVYSLGVMLYEMLAGALPYEGDSVVDIFEAARLGSRTPLDEHCPGLPVGLSDLVDRAMRAEREERFASARELHDAIAAVVAQASTDPERDPPTDPKQIVVEPTTVSSPLQSDKPDSVPDREISDIARRSDAVIGSRRRELKTVELARDEALAPAPASTTPQTQELPERAPADRRTWIWLLVALVTLIVSGVIGAAALTLMR